MAFPTIPTVAGGRILFTLNTAGGATKTFPDLGSLTKNAGDLLLAIIVEYDGNSTNAEFSNWGGGFTETADLAGTATMAIGVAHKWSTGSETGTFTVTTADTTTNDSVLILVSIEGAHATTAPAVGVMSTSASQPPAVGTTLDPSGWVAEDTLWIAVGGSGETSTTGSFTAISAPPANYTGHANSGITADVVGGVNASVAFRQLNATSEAPGTWTGDTSNARGAATVIAVRPAASTAFTRTPADTITLSDAPALGVDLVPTDTITLSDSRSQVWAASLSMSDTVTLSDVATKLIGLVPEDTLTLSDAMVPLIILTLTLGDTITLSDSTAKAVGASLADTLSTSDALAAADALFRADSITLAEAISLHYGLPHADSLALADQLAQALGLHRTDTLTLSDIIDPVLTPGSSGLTLDLADTIQLRDDLARALNGLFLDSGAAGARVRTIILDRFGIY